MSVETALDLAKELMHLDRRLTRLEEQVQELKQVVAAQKRDLDTRLYRVEGIINQVILR